MRMLSFVVFLALSSPATAQVYKCIAAGKTVYSGTPCADGTPRDIQTSATNVKSEGSASPAQSSYDRELRALISKALATDDFKKAESLAVTAEHWDMIAEAKNRKRELDIEKKKARASQPRSPSCFSQTLVSGRIYTHCN